VSRPLRPVCSPVPRPRPSHSSSSPMPKHLGVRAGRFTLLTATRPLCTWKHDRAEARSRFQGLAVGPAPRSRPPLPAHRPDRSPSAVRFLAATRQGDARPAPGPRSPPRRSPLSWFGSFAGDTSRAVLRPSGCLTSPAVHPPARRHRACLPLVFLRSVPGATRLFELTAHPCRSVGSGLARVAMPIAPTSVTTACLPDVPKRVPRASRCHRSVGQRGHRRKSWFRLPKHPVPPIAADPAGRGRPRRSSSEAPADRSPSTLPEAADPSGDARSCCSRRSAAPKRRGDSSHRSSAGLLTPAAAGRCASGPRSGAHCPLAAVSAGRLTVSAELPPLPKRRSRSCGTVNQSHDLEAWFPACPAHRGVRSWPGLRLVPADDVPD
jgi:hypothetical protein